jgi:hypothetical protein
LTINPDKNAAIMDITSSFVVCIYRLLSKSSLKWITAGPARPKLAQILATKKTLTSFDSLLRNQAFQRVIATSNLQASKGKKSFSLSSHATGLACGKSRSASS